MATPRPHKQLPPLSLASTSPGRPRALAAPLAASLWNSLVLPPSPAPPSPLPATEIRLCAFPPEGPALVSRRALGSRSRPREPLPHASGLTAEGTQSRILQTKSRGTVPLKSLPSPGCQWPLSGFWGLLSLVPECLLWCPQASLTL